jgi:hypothetical protein
MNNDVGPHQNMVGPDVVICFKDLLGVRLRLQKAPKAAEGVLRLFASQSVVHGVVADGKFHFAALGEIGDHNLQQGPGVHLAGASLADCDRKSRVSDGADECCGRTRMQAHRGCHHGLLNWQRDSFFG